MNPNKNIPEEKIFFFDNQSIELVQDLKRTVEIPNKYKDPESLPVFPTPVFHGIE